MLRLVRRAVPANWDAPLLGRKRLNVKPLECDLKKKLEKAIERHEGDIGFERFLLVLLLSLFVLAAMTVAFGGR